MINLLSLAITNLVSVGIRNFFSANLFSANFFSAGIAKAPAANLFFGAIAKLIPVAMKGLASLGVLAIGGEIFSLIRQTGAVAQAVLIILLIFSIMSWSVILTKWSSVRRAR